MMNNNLTIPFFISLFFSVGSVLSAQQQDLQELLAGKDKVEEIMEIVESYYDREYPQQGHDTRDEEDEEEEHGFLHWARWGEYMSAHTDEEGRLVDADQLVREAYAEHRNSDTRSNTGNWTFKGPAAISGTYGSAAGIARMDRIAFHPTNANIIYAGSPCGGLYRTIDGGDTWTPLTDNIPSVSISGIVVSYADGNDVYILTGDGDSKHGGLVESSGFMRSSAGVFVSNDGGTNWYARPLPINGSYAGYNLAQSPADPNVLLAATDVGLYRTTNGGNSWTQVLAGKTYEVKFKPASGIYVYATQLGKVYRSIDGGVTWNMVTDYGSFPIPSTGRVALAVTNANPNFVYLLSGAVPGGEVIHCGDDPNTSFGGVYRSTNSGLSFIRQCYSPNLVESCCEGVNSRDQQEYDLAIAASHANAGIVVVGGIIVWTSTNGGEDWVNTTGVECGDNAGGMVHTDIHDIEYNPLDGQVYLANDGGLVKSNNHGGTWVNISEGLSAATAYHMAGSLVDIDNMIIGLQDNGCKRRNSNTTTWDPAVGSDGFDCIYNLNSATEGYMGAYKEEYRFWNNGSNKTNISPNGKTFKRITSGVNNPDLVLIGCDSMFRSTNAGASWTGKHVSGWWDIERCPSNVNRFYAAGGNSAFATTGEMVISNDQGIQWDTISNNTGFPTVNVRITDIEVRPNLSGNVWITLGGFSSGNKVFFSNDAGGTWFNRSGSLPNVPITCIQVDANNNAYIGTDIGVYYRGSGSNDWVPFWNRLPMVPVSDMELYEADGILRVSTFGRGVWESPVYSACTASLGLTGNLSGHRYYEVSSLITSTNSIFGGANTNIVFKAGNSINLTTGFEAKTGCTLHAYIAPCGQAQND